MTTQKRITKPGRFDNEFMLVTCTPEATSVEFFEEEREAAAAARLNTHPTTTTYVSRIIKQGDHRVRGSSKHIAVHVEIDDEMARALAAHGKARSRRQVWKLLTAALESDLEEIRAKFRSTPIPEPAKSILEPQYPLPGQQACGQLTLNGWPCLLQNGHAVPCRCQLASPLSDARSDCP